MHVTTIIPVFNCEQYIEDAIESALGQSYENIDIIVVDDGSTDDTRNKIKKFKNRVEYIYQENQGSSKARNIGIQMAKGEYIAFLDADDRWHTNKIETQMRVFQVLPEVDMVFTDYSTIDPNGIHLDHFALEKGFPIFNEYKIGIRDIFPHRKPIHLQFTDDSLNANFDQSIYFGNVFNKLFMGNFILPSTELIKRRSIYPSCMFNEEYRRAEDQDFHVRFSRDHIIAFLNLSTTDYRINIKNKLSENKNIPELIANSIETKLSTIRNDNDFSNNNRHFIRYVLSKDYARLSYYYLTELKCREAKIHAMRSVNQKPIQLRAYYLLLLANLPRSILNCLRNFKRLVQHLRYMRSTRTI